jgi:hypothetical protein
MPHQLLHRAKVDPGHHEATCEGMPEAMPRKAQKLCSPDGWLKPIASALFRSVPQWGAIEQTTINLIAVQVAQFRGMERLLMLLGAIIENGKKFARPQ